MLNVCTITNMFSHLQDLDVLPISLLLRRIDEERFKDILNL